MSDIPIEGKLKPLVVGAFVADASDVEVSGGGSVQAALDGVATSTEAIQDIVGTMVDNNTEVGLTVAYDDGAGKLNFTLDFQRLFSGPSSVFQGQATLAYNTGTTGPGRVLIYNGTNPSTINRQIFFPAMSDPAQVGSFWVIQNTSPQSIELRPASGAAFRTGVASLTVQSGQAMLLFAQSFDAGGNDLYDAFLLGGTIGGSAGASGEGSAGVLAGTAIDIRVVNTTGGQLNAGTPTRVAARGGQMGISAASNGNIPNSWCTAGGADSELVTARLFGLIPDAPTWGTDDLGTFEPLAAGTRLYYDAVNHRASTISINAQGNSRAEFGEVATSIQVTPAEITRTPGTDYSFLNQGAVDGVSNTTNVFIGTGASTFTLPTEEGGGVIIPSQTRIVVESGGGVVVTIAPGAADVMVLRSNPATTYTNASPLVLSETSVAQARVIEWNDTLSRWEAYDNREDIIRTTFFFSGSDFNDDRVSQQTFLVQLIAQNALNTTEVLEYNPRIPVTVAARTLGTPNAIYHITGSTDNNRTITVNSGSLFGFPANQSVAQFMVYNDSDTYWVRVINHADNGNFGGVGDTEFWMAPQEHRRFNVVFDGVGGYTVVPEGRVAYPFTLEAGLFGGAWTVAGDNDIPTTGANTIFTIPVGNTDRMQVTRSCDLQDVRLDMQWLFTGTAAADFAGLLMRTPAVHLNRSGSNVQSGHDSSLVNLAGSKAEYHQEFREVAMSAGQYIHLTGVDLTDVTGVTLRLRGEIVVKDD